MEYRLVPTEPAPVPANPEEERETSGAAEVKSSEKEEEKKDPTKREESPEDVHSFMWNVRGALSKVGLMGSQSKSSSGKQLGRARQSGLLLRFLKWFRKARCPLRFPLRHRDAPRKGRVCFA